MAGRIIVAVIVNAIALFLTIQIVPGLDWPGKFSTGQDIVALIAVAIIFGLVNTFLRPIVRLVSLPVNLATLGLFGIVLNGLLFLLVALLANAVGIEFTVGGFPPDFSFQTITAALAGSIVVSVVGAILGLLVNRD